LASPKPDQERANGHQPKQQPDRAYRNARGTLGRMWSGSSSPSMLSTAGRVLAAAVRNGGKFGRPLLRRLAMSGSRGAVFGRKAAVLAIVIQAVVRVRQPRAAQPDHDRPRATAFIAIFFSMSLPVISFQPA